MHVSKKIAAVSALVVALRLAAVPALASSSHATGKSVTVKASEFKFRLSVSSVSAPGSVTFNVVNQGKIQHDFKIAGKKTILLNPGKSSKLTVTLKKGKYVYLCTVAGHAKLGMKGTFTVK